MNDINIELRAVLIQIFIRFFKIEVAIDFYVIGYCDVRPRTCFKVWPMDFLNEQKKNYEIHK